jgi:hypothetical protein
MSLMKPTFTSQRAEVMLGTWNLREIIVKRATNQSMKSSDITSLKNEVKSLKYVGDACDGFI